MVLFFHRCGHISREEIQVNKDFYLEFKVSFWPSLQKLSIVAKASKMLSDSTSQRVISSQSQLFVNSHEMHYTLYSGNYYDTHSHFTIDIPLEKNLSETLVFSLKSPTKDKEVQVATLNIKEFIEFSKLKNVKKDIRHSTKDDLIINWGIGSADYFVGETKLGTAEDPVVIPRKELKEICNIQQREGSNLCSLYLTWGKNEEIIVSESNLKVYFKIEAEIRQTIELY